MRKTFHSDIKEFKLVRFLSSKLFLQNLNSNAIAWSLWRLYKLVLLDTVWCDQLHIFPLLSTISFLHPYWNHHFMKKKFFALKTFVRVFLSLRKFNKKMLYSTIKIWKSREIWETPLFCLESLYCDTWLSESLVRHHTTLFLLL